MEDKKHKKRTLKQNASLHVWIEELARECNHKGVSYKAVVQNLEVNWTPEAVKGIIQAVAYAMYSTHHTSELTTKQLSEACKEVDKIFLEQGVNIIFPSFEEAEFIKHYSNN